jgi:2-polyprenyl-3-methyl-5-hydroxy-6-metoxy-1,4-benzoquinol methylase
MADQNLAERLFRNANAALEMYAIYLGERLGLYQALADGGPATPAELALRAGIHERYAMEWLEHQAASGLLEFEDGRFLLPAEHIPVLVDKDDLTYSAHSAIEMVRAARRMADLVDAYRTGTAPPPQPWGPEGRVSPNRPRVLNLLGQEWLPAIKEVDARLRDQPPARVADIACGTGWSSIAMAKAYPSIIVHGLDLDANAIEAAKRSAAEAGVADRVTFSATNAADLTEPGFDLVMVIEALHDMTHPVDVLRTLRGLLAVGGSVLVVDTRVEEEFTAPAPLRDQYEYGWSVVACLPDAMGEPGSAMTGTAMRPATLRRYATEAGFTTVSMLPIETDYWRFYRLTNAQ